MQPKVYISLYQQDYKNIIVDIMEINLSRVHLFTSLTSLKTSTMKTFITIIFVAFIANICISQPVLDSSDFTFNYNHKFIVKRATNYQTITSGENIIWDFSSLDTSINKTDTVEFAILDSICNGMLAPGGYFSGAFPNSNMIIKNSSAFYLYANTNSELYMEGDGSCSYVGIYNNPMKLMNFPFSYDSTFYDGFAGVVPGFPFPYNSFSGGVNVHADAYGTLILPNKTFNNVLKLRIIQTTSIPNTSSVDTIYFDTWYYPGIPFPVLELTNSGGAKYLDQLINKIKISDKISNTINVYPIPTEGSITLSLKVANTDLKYTIIDIFGKSVITGVFNGQAKNYKIDIQSLNSRMYFLHIESNGKHYIRKILKK